MIINTGMRTDIPAFYSQWFMNRIRAGFVLVRNPYRPDSEHEALSGHIKNRRFLSQEPAIFS